MPNNEQRARRARTALFAHYAVEDEITDLLVNLMHLCRWEDIDFSTCQHLAAIHFNAELGPED